MKKLILLILILLGTSQAVKELMPTLWANALIDDGGSFGLNLDYDETNRFAWGACFGFGIFRDYYVLYPGLEGRLYFSDRSMGPVRLYISSNLGLGLGSHNQSNGETALTMGGFGNFTMGGDFLTTDSVTPTIMLGGFLDTHSQTSITSLLIGAGIRF